MIPLMNPVPLSHVGRLGGNVKRTLMMERPEDFLTFLSLCPKNTTVDQAIMKTAFAPHKKKEADGLDAPAQVFC